MSDRDYHMHLGTHHGPVIDWLDAQLIAALLCAAAIEAELDMRILADPAHWSNAYP